MKRCDYLQREAYSSIAMLHPDGTLMCRIGKRRADWYLDRDLAEKVNEQDIKLNFLPKGYGRYDEEYFTEERQNICVVCGINEKLTKHHVVPEEYRKLLPFEFKAYNDHDVILLCRRDHDEYEKKANFLKKEILENIGYDFSKLKKINNHNYRIRTAKRILKNIEVGKIKNMPMYKLEELQYTASLELKEDDGWHDLFFNIYNTNEKLQEFCVRWRKHFVEHASPKFLSKHWKIDYIGRL